MAETKWVVGQKAVINRQTVVTIERVTPAGRAVSGGRAFEANGAERSGTSSFTRSRLELLTPEIRAEIALVHRGQKAGANAFTEIERATKWLRQNFSSWNYRIPEVNDVSKAEQLAVAIRQLIDGAQDNGR